MSKRLTVILIAIMILAVAGAAVCWYVAGIRDAVRDFYDLAAMSYILQLHLREHDCRWPASWQDLESAAAEVFQNTQIVDDLSQRVIVDWAIDPCAAVAAGDARPLLISIQDAPESSLQWSNDVYELLARECCGDESDAD